MLTVAEKEFQNVQRDRLALIQPQFPSAQQQQEAPPQRNFVLEVRRYSTQGILHSFVNLKGENIDQAQFSERSNQTLAVSNPLRRSQSQSDRSVNESDIQPQPLDCIIGFREPSQSAENQQLNNIIIRDRTRDFSSLSDMKKTKVSKTIVDEFKEASGRFLGFDKSKWVLASDKEAQESVGSPIRPGETNHPDSSIVALDPNSAVLTPEDLAKEVFPTEMDIHIGCRRKGQEGYRFLKELMLQHLGDYRSASRKKNRLRTTVYEKIYNDTRADNRRFLEPIKDTSKWKEASRKDALRWIGRTISRFAHDTKKAEEAANIHSERSAAKRPNPDTPGFLEAREITSFRTALSNLITRSAQRTRTNVSLLSYHSRDDFDGRGPELAASFLSLVLENQTIKSGPVPQQGELIYRVDQLLFASDNNPLADNDVSRSDLIQYSYSLLIKACENIIQTSNKEYAKLWVKMKEALSDCQSSSLAHERNIQAEASSNRKRPKLHHNLFA